MIAAPGAEQTWIFLGNAGQRVFFDGQNPCAGFQDLRFTVTTPTGTTLLDSQQLSGCAFDVGTVTLPMSGTYRVRVFKRSVPSARTRSRSGTCRRPWPYRWH